MRLSAEWIAFIVSLTALVVVHVSVPVAIAVQTRRGASARRAAKTRHLIDVSYDPEQRHTRSYTLSAMLDAKSDEAAAFEAAPRVAPNIYERGGGAFGIRDGPAPRARGLVKGYIAAVGYGGRAAVAVKGGRLVWFDEGYAVGVEVPDHPCEILALASDHNMDNLAVLYTTHLAINGQKMMDTLGDACTVSAISAFHRTDDDSSGSIYVRLRDGSILQFSPLETHTTPTS